MAERGVPTVRTSTLATAFLIVVTGAGCTPLDDVMASIFGRSMRDQPAIQPYENPRLPAEGSVPFASGNFPAAPDQVGLGQAEGIATPPPITPIQLLQGAPEAVDLENPVSSSAESLARGEVMFNRSCAPCHAMTGDGTGPVTQAGVIQYSLLTDQARGLSDGYIYSIIRIGRGMMPAYGHQLTHFDRWHVVNYVRQLQGLLPDEGTPGDAGQDE